MQAQPIAEEDPAAAIAPPVRPTMPWRVASVEALPRFRLRVRFLDSLEGTVDMSALIASPNAGVFAALADPDAFNRAFVALASCAGRAASTSLPMRSMRASRRAAAASTPCRKSREPDDGGCSAAPAASRPRRMGAPDPTALSPASVPPCASAQSVVVTCQNNGRAGQPPAADGSNADEEAMIADP